MKPLLTGLAVYGLFTLAGTAAAAHCVGWIATRQWCLAALCLIAGFVIPLAVFWPGKAKPRAAVPPELEQAYREHLAATEKGPHQTGAVR